MDFCEHIICQPVFFIFCVRAKLDTLLEFKEITALCGWIVLGVHMASNFRSSKTHTLTIAQGHTKDDAMGVCKQDLQA